MEKKGYVAIGYKRRRRQTDRGLKEVNKRKTDTQNMSQRQAASSGSSHQSDSVMSDSGLHHLASGPVLTAMCPLVCLTVTL